MATTPKTDLYEFAYDLIDFMKEKVAEASSVVDRDRGAANAALEECLCGVLVLQARINAPGEDIGLKMMAAFLWPGIERLRDAQKGTRDEFRKNTEAARKTLDGLLGAVSRQRP